MYLTFYKKQKIAFIRHNNTNHSTIFFNHIYATFRNGEHMAQGKCTLKLKCEPESQHCICFSNVICISPSLKVDESLGKEDSKSDNKFSS